MRRFDPIVWAAIFGAAFHDEYATVMRVADGLPLEVRRMSAAKSAHERATEEADTAMRVAYPEEARLVDAGWTDSALAGDWRDPVTHERHHVSEALRIQRERDAHPVG